MIVENVKVYGLNESIKAAKYPKAVNIEKLNSDVTEGIQALATADRGSGHDNFLNGIVVQFDLNCTIKCGWKRNGIIFWTLFHPKARCTRLRNLTRQSSATITWTRALWRC